MADVLILDSGSDTIKIGRGSENAPVKLPNMIYKAKNSSSRLFVSNEIDTCRNKSALFYLSPKENGYTVNWDVQRTIYEHIFYDTLNLDCANMAAVVTEPEMDPLANQRTLDELFFEDYGFKALYRCNNSAVVASRYQAMSKSEGCVIVESGHSSTHIVPYWRGRKITSAVMRLNVGGQLLSNYLKELVSYRQMNLIDEYMVCARMKEKACFCVADFKVAMAKKESYAVNYILPNYTLNTPGRMQTAGESLDQERDQFIRLKSERFQVPELLFNPSDAQIDQCGLHEAVHHAILKCPPDQQPILYRNIMAMGGSMSFAGFRQRLLDGVRGLANDEYDVRVGDPKNPADYAWVCAARMSRAPTFQGFPFKLRDGNEPIFRAILRNATTVARRGPSNNGEEIRTDLNFDFKRSELRETHCPIDKNKQITR